MGFTLFDRHSGDFHHLGARHGDADHHAIGIVQHLQPFHARPNLQHVRRAALQPGPYEIGIHVKDRNLVFGAELIECPKGLLQMADGSQGDDA